MESLLDRLLALRFSWPLRYLLATLLIAAATGLRLLTSGTLKEYPYLLYYPVVIICGVILDFGTSVYATFVCAVLAVYLFVPPPYSLVLFSTDDTVALFLFIVSSLMISVVIEVLRLGSERLKASRDETRKALHERNLLLKELSHRTRNDFEIANSLLRMQSREATTGEAQELLKDASDRIAVMARVHSRLESHDEVPVINLNVFLADLVADFQSASVGRRIIDIDLASDKISLPQKQATYIGLIVNELMTNAIKYAFPDGRPGRVAVVLKAEDAEMVLNISDNGVGVQPNSGTGLGTRLVKSLVGALDGRVEVEKQNGTTYTIHLPYPTL